MTHSVLIQVDELVEVKITQISIYVSFLNHIAIIWNTVLRISVLGQFGDSTKKDGKLHIGTPK